MISISDNDFNRLVTYVHDNYGIDLSRKRVMIEGRLGNVLEKRGFKDYSSYLDMIFADKTGSEVVNLMTKLTTNHTYFLREPEHYDFMRNVFLPEMKQRKKDKTIYLWSAGCSSGEEPYTNAIEMAEFFGAEAHQWDTKLLATDISVKVLAKAQQAVYHKDSMKNLSPEVVKKYFIPMENDCFQVNQDIRKQVVYKVFNLMDSIPYKKHPFDLIFCRNVMIYFDAETKVELVNRFYDVLAPGGYLFIGHAESIPRDATGYKYIKPAIYQKPF
ncbi:MAG: protein-glutamate O-methyltransferase CheR [Oscillospiraceae bacterium]|nr:protein-glutamate O-methyltransferase CheR [Oscillospiraceae bacterium]